jgi:hypothetical protein
MYHRHDQFTKNLLRDALTRAGDAETEVPVTVAPQSIDVYCVPDPARAAERAQMGLLGELAEEPSLFEPFRNTPSLNRVQECLRKQLNWRHELKRRAQAAAHAATDSVLEEEAPAEEAPEEVPGEDPRKTMPLPTLVVISPGRPETVLREYLCRRKRRGVYHSAARGLKLWVVVLAELPRTRKTLLLRLLGKGRVLQAALADLARLPYEAWEQSIATPLLLHFQIETAASATNEEDDVSAEIQAWYEEYQRKLRAEVRNEVRAEERKEGRAEEAARAVLTALRVRGIAVPGAARKRILAQKDPERLERWHELAIVAASVAEVLDEPS